MRPRFTQMVCLAALTAAIAFPQRGPGGGNGPAPTAGSAATFLQRRVDSLATLLSLTDSQKKQALKIFTDAETATSANQTKISTSRTAIRDAVKKNDIATIESQSAALGTLVGQNEAIQAKADAAFYALLTPDQRTKYDELRSHGPGRGNFPGMMGRRPGGWAR